MDDDVLVLRTTALHLRGATANGLASTPRYKGGGVVSGRRTGAGGSWGSTTTGGAIERFLWAFTTTRRNAGGSSGASSTRPPPSRSRPFRGTVCKYECQCDRLYSPCAKHGGATYWSTYGLLWTDTLATNAESSSTGTVSAPSCDTCSWFTSGRSSTRKSANKTVTRAFDCGSNDGASAYTQGTGSSKRSSNPATTCSSTRSTLCPGPRSLSNTQNAGHKNDTGENTLIVTPSRRSATLLTPNAAERLLRVVRVTRQERVSKQPQRCEPPLLREPRRAERARPELPQHAPGLGQQLFELGCQAFRPGRPHRQHVFVTPVVAQPH